MDFLGIHAATAVGVTGKDADGTGKPTGSSAPGAPDPDLKSLPTEPTRLPDPDSTLPARKDHPPAQISFLRAPERPDFDRNASLEERSDPTRQPDRDDGSRLRGRDEPRRQP